MKKFLEILLEILKKISEVIVPLLGFLKKPTGKTPRTVLKGALVKVHSIAHAGTSSNTPPLGLLEIDITITPIASAGKTNAWRPKILVLAPVDGFSSDDEAFGFVERYQLWQNGIFIDGEQDEVDGEQRVKLIVAAPPSLKNCHFRYYLETFGKLEIPPPGAIPVAFSGPQQEAAPAISAPTTNPQPSPALAVGKIMPGKIMPGRISTPAPQPEAAEQQQPAAPSALSSLNNLTGNVSKLAQHISSVTSTIAPEKLPWVDAAKQEAAQQNVNLQQAAPASSDTPQKPETLKSPLLQPLAKANPNQAAEPNIQNQPANSTPPPLTPPSTQAPPPTPQPAFVTPRFMSESYYILRNNNPVGPYSSSQLERMAKIGTLSQDDYVWKEGSADWVPASKILSGG